MNIATALNKKYLLYTGVMLTSLCQNNKEHIDAFLLHSELEETDIQFLTSSLSDYDIDIIPVCMELSKFTGLPTTASWTVEIYYRLLLPELLPSTVDRIFYFDVDMIINRSLQELYYSDLGDQDLFVVEDIVSQKKMYDLYTDKQLEKFLPLLQQGYRYFNSGFMLMNLSLIREKYSYKAYIEAMNEWNYKMGAPDQDILNWVHREKVTYLPTEYNFFARFAYVDGYNYQYVKENAFVIHFTAEKPWETASWHFDTEKLWWDYAKLTPFYSEILEIFLHLSLFDVRLEEQLKNYTEHQQDLTKKLQQAHSITQKLLGKI